MSPDNARRLRQEASQQTSEIVGGYSDAVIVDGNSIVLNAEVLSDTAIERACEEREYQLRLVPAEFMARVLGVSTETLLAAVDAGDLPCIRSDEQLLFDPVGIEIRLREQSIDCGARGNSETIIPTGGGVSP